MKINRSVLIALFALLMIGAWFWVNSGRDKSGSSSTSATSQAETQTEKKDERPTVVVQNSNAITHALTYELFGRSEPNREVTVKAETMGLVAATPVKEGSVVTKGTVVCRQDVDARQANLEQAQAMLRTRELEYNAAKTLVEKGYRSETQAATAQAAFDGAKAAVKQAKIELDNVNIRAPFKGVFDRQIAEVGDFLSPGQPCGLILELDPLIVVAELTETQVGNITEGQEAEVKLATGEILTGRIRFIESRANVATRTFRTEISLPNPDMRLKAGITGTVRLKAGDILAQHVPSSIQTLSDNGQVGIRYLDDQNIVQFALTQTVDEDINGIWVTGLPEQTRIIVQGQDYVAVGSEANPTLVDMKQAASQ